ncbi:MAG: hypothetical protein RRA94_02370 [Bacteroidota bacterium]|nr:hypothetical protein [Bacteroidota bacterium]
MADHSNEKQTHPANAVFALMDDRNFRYSVVRPALEADKTALARLTTGKHQVRGFRNIARAPLSMLLPIMSEEANLSPELATRVLTHWFDTQDELRETVSAKLKELGYEPGTTALDEEGNANWMPLKKEHADLQFDGNFLPEQEHNSVLLMSLLLGWFGSEEEDGEEDSEDDEDAGA